MFDLSKPKNTAYFNLEGHGFVFILPFSLMLNESGIQQHWMSFPVIRILSFYYLSNITANHK